MRPEQHFPPVPPSPRWTWIDVGCVVLCPRLSQALDEGLAWWGGEGSVGGAHVCVGYALQTVPSEHLMGTPPPLLPEVKDPKVHTLRLFTIRERPS